MDLRVNFRVKASQPNKSNNKKPDNKKFPCLDLAREAARRGGTHPSALCAADEVLIPVETGFFSLHGLSRQLEVVESLQALTQRTLAVGSSVARSLNAAGLSPGHYQLTVTTDAPTPCSGE